MRNPAEEYDVTSTGKYAKAISVLKLRFDTKILGFKTNKKLFDLFLILFSLSVDEDVAANMKIKIVDLQYNKIVQEQCNNVNLSNFYSKYIDAETHQE